MRNSFFRPSNRSVAHVPSALGRLSNSKQKPWCRLPTTILQCGFAGALLMFAWLGSRIRDEINSGSSFNDMAWPVHNSMEIGRTQKIPAIRTRKHKLRFDWENLPLHSDLAKRLYAHQSNCSLPLANFPYRNLFGLGSDLHVWGQTLCNAMQQKLRVRTLMPWAWLDETTCDLNQANRSAMLCYFPKSELLCKGDEAIVDIEGSINVTFRKRVGFNCESIMKEGITIPELRAAGAELLFSAVSRLVVQQAERQLNLVFPNGVPTDLVTVQIRWGDKKREMKLLSIDYYIKGVTKLLEEKGLSTETAHVFLSTEDPEAVKGFQQSCPPGWKVYVDQYFQDMLPYRVVEYNGNPKASKETKGHAGLIALGSLLVAMEANLFVLTTASNWSRLMNELRKNIINPRCNNCTLMVDLKYGEW